jgi:hypothetical protein
MKKQLSEILEVDKLIFLLKISGTVEDLRRGLNKKELVKLGGIRNIDKFTKVIDYFKELR